jgi:erythromycin esterase-like protein
LKLGTLRPHQPSQADGEVLNALRANARPLSGHATDYSPLLELIGDARFALLGEASHGTHEFYQERAEITKRLIVEKGFTAIAVEADWPDAWRVNRYVRGMGEDTDADAALASFQRFPGWMWRNTVVRDFVEWLRDYNRSQVAQSQVGFYGMDLYSLFASMQAVLSYLEQKDPPAALRARQRYACFDHVGCSSQAYSYAAAWGIGKSCEAEVVAQLAEMRRSSAALFARGDSDELFYAQQNARLVMNAEAYYREMFHSRVSSWNLRDSHMVETLQELERHLSRHGKAARMAVWAHNSHLGDAGATEMGERGEWNVGQLMRERYSSDAVLIGFSTYHGMVTAATEWDGPALHRRIRPGLHGSYEALFHQVGIKRFMLLLQNNRALRNALREPRLQRAIGVIYMPDSERQSHYFHTRLDQQFDAMIHIDETRALEPLDTGVHWSSPEAPETYPSGI